MATKPNKAPAVSSRGGRRSTTWRKGEKPPHRSPGRPKGSKDKLPRSWKGSIKALFEEVGTEHPDIVFAAILKGLKAPPPKSFQYLNLMTNLIDGKEADAIPFDRVRQLVLSMVALFLDVVDDSEQRRRFSEGVRRITGLIEAERTTIDAESAPQN